ncbi:hypothetical protein B484DRAFT_269677 [Ochromonadaceae sp. CCMP2298]|nr:hypothetical protein B484DRAFT_269677 [Ochromonadaceae sp. CCMP2298]
MIGRYGGSHPTQSAPIVLKQLEVQINSFLTLSGYGCTFPTLSLYELIRYLVRLPSFHVVGGAVEGLRDAAGGIAHLLAGGRIMDNPHNPIHPGNIGNMGMHNMGMGSGNLGMDLLGNVGMGNMGMGSGSSRVSSRPNTGSFQQLQGSRVSQR